MRDIITFGTATRDIVVKPEASTSVFKKTELSSGKKICFFWGSKIELDDIRFFSGGGGTNAAATFAKQGFETAFLGGIGNDEASKNILDELKKLKIDARFVVKAEANTNHAIVILSESKKRTILVYHGIEKEIIGREIPFKKLKSRWFYLAPLSGFLLDNFEGIVNFAHENKIKIAMNPGMAQLSLPNNRFRDILKKVDILIMNQEEASFLTKIPFENEKEVFKKIDEICPAIAVMTKGEKGAVASDGRYVYSAEVSKNISIIDTTGAGDAFGSGFVAEFIRSGDIEKSMQFAMANSASCLFQMGAKNGLLEKGQKFEPVKVDKSLCDNNVCVIKNNK